MTKEFRVSVCLCDVILGLATLYKPRSFRVFLFLADNPSWEFHSGSLGLFRHLWAPLF